MVLDGRQRNGITNINRLAAFNCQNDQVPFLAAQHAVKGAGTAGGIDHITAVKTEFLYGLVHPRYKAKVGIRIVVDQYIGRLDEALDLGVDIYRGPWVRPAVFRSVRGWLRRWL